MAVSGAATAQYIQKLEDMRDSPEDACQLNIPMENRDYFEVSNGMKVWNV